MSKSEILPELKTEIVDTPLASSLKEHKDNNDSALPEHPQVEPVSGLSAEGLLQFENELEPISSKALLALLILIVIKYLSRFLYFMGINEASNASDLAPILVFIAVLYLLYKIWSIAYHLGISKRSPGFVIIALFLPIVNLYYIFKSFLGWALIYNKAVSKLEKEPEEHRMPVFLGFLASIMPFFVIISFIHNYSRPNFFVERSGKYIQVRNREQIKPNEEVYTITNLNILNKGAREDVPSKGEYYFISSIPSLPFLIYDIILILFFKFALDCANHLVNLHKKLSEV